MKRTAVLFDMDGLMIDTEPLAELAWTRVAAEYDATISPTIFRAMLGRRTIESAQLVRDGLELPVSLEALVARKTAIYLSILDEGIPVMPGLWALLDRLEEQGIPRAVATSTPRPLATHILGKLGVLERFGALACGDEVVHGKPSPDIYLLAAERLGHPAAACLALEDTTTGCTAAAAAGARVIAVPTDLSRHETFTCAYRRVGSLAEVATMLDQLLAD